MSSAWQANRDPRRSAQVFQPAIYSQAFADAYGYLPTFTFVVRVRSGSAQLGGLRFAHGEGQLGLGRRVRADTDVQVAALVRRQLE